MARNQRGSKSRSSKGRSRTSGKSSSQPTKQTARGRRGEQGSMQAKSRGQLPRDTGMSQPRDLDEDLTIGS